MSFRVVAGLLLPADGDGVVIRAGEDWGPPRPDGDPATVIWGRGPSWERAGAPLLRSVVRRERSVRGLRRQPPGGRRVTGVHRWSLRFYRPRVAANVMWRLREGVLVELARDPSAPRHLDVAARAAGVAQRIESFHVGAGGSVCARAEVAGAGPAMLRVAPAGSALDPNRAAAALQRLEPVVGATVPRLIAHGAEGPAAWSAETLLPGRVPARVTAEVVEAVAAFCATLPAADGPARAFDEAFAGLAGRLPQLEAGLRAVRDRVAGVVAGLPSVVGHGDLWAGNLLTRDGRLTGVVDWDGWHPSALPGTDLMHLVASARAFAAHRTFAELLADPAWSPDGEISPAARAYWRALDIEPTAPVHEAVAVGWWAAQTQSRLAREPSDAADPQWIRRNVEPVLARFG